MPNTVAEMTPGDLQEMIEFVVEQKLIEIFGDPDAGMELRDDLKERLIQQQRAVAAGDLGRPFDEVVRELGLG